MNRITTSITNAAATLVTGIGVLVLIGWQANIAFLKQVFPKLVAMNPMVAVAFIFCGTALLLRNQQGYQRIIAKSCAGIVILFALLRIGDVMGLINLRVDHLLYAKGVDATLYNGMANQVVPHAAIAFLLCGISLLLLESNRITAAQWIVLPVNGIGILSFTGYIYHLSSYYVVTSFVPLSFHTGIGFILLSTALLLARSDKGFMAAITNQHAGGKAARLLLPAMVVISVWLGYYVLNGVLRERFSVAVWVTLFVCAVIFMFGILIWITAYIINKVEQKRIAEKQAADEQRRLLAEYKYRESQERYQQLMNTIDGIVWEADAQTFAFTFVSEQAERILGYPLERWLNEPDFWPAHIHEDDRTWAVNYCAQTTAQGQAHQFEYRMHAADGRIIWMRDIVAVVMEGNKPVRLSGIMVDITEQKKMEEELHRKELSQQKLITEITILAQEKERNELGLELHDNINQLLSVVKLYLGLIKTEKKYNEELVDKSYAHLMDAMNDIRKLSHSLVAPSLGHDGLKEALEDLIESIQQPHQLTIQLLLDEDYDALEVDKDKELMLYRIVQEQLNNIIKYAYASNIRIELKQKGNQLHLTISDNGIGFDTKQSVNGIGLKNINSRVNFYSGNMKLTSAPGQGCTLEVAIPN
ncbi:PAS domain S-box-containing protein [Lacibacter cauensis]|uniref:Oxygen sensor histidine kinase NreB n=1 Tax=Lacibacter cauensis TaxID=510947 RepID=A0A562SDE6_9BACT|nr:PAS domain-containing protein [Lacibacter cauensis]TWI79248.1 PAS domain S-box-containing protein [Lacibacter cauensis]